jgi:hypothetical protein
MEGVTRIIPTKQGTLKELKDVESERINPTKPLNGEDTMAQFWKAKARTSPSVEDYEKRLAAIWRETGCAAEERAPYVVQRFLRLLEMKISPFGEKSPHPAVLAAAFLDEANCRGAAGLSDGDKGRLNAIITRSETSASRK